MSARSVGAVVLGLAAGMACGAGAERSSGSGGDAAGKAPSPAALKAACSGTLTGGPVAGDFTCMAVANHYAEGGDAVEGRKNAIVTVLNNPYDPSHTRPKGVQSLGFNIELPGEPKAGTYDAAHAGATTHAHVNYEDGRQFGRIQSLTLTLTEATFQNETEAFGIKAKVYRVRGSLEATLGDGAGGEVQVTASF